MSTFFEVGVIPQLAISKRRDFDPRFRISFQNENVKLLQSPYACGSADIDEIDPQSSQTFSRCLGWEEK